VLEGLAFAYHVEYGDYPVHERVLLEFRHPQELVDAERAGSVKVQLFAEQKGTKQTFSLGLLFY